MTETPQQDRVNTEHLRDYSELRRSVADRKLAGVAGGLGRHLNIDPTILRVAFVVLALFGGAGLILYAALWAFVPEDGKDEAVISTSAGTRNVLLAVAAIVAALVLFGVAAGGETGFPWPLAVLALVVVFLLMNRDKPMTTQRPPGEWTAGPSTGQPPAEAPGTDAPGTGDAGTTHTTTGTMTLPPESTYYGNPPAAAPYSGAVPPASAPYPVEQPPAPRPHRGPKLFWFTVALLAVGLGALGLYDVTSGEVVDAAYPALALTIVGIMLVVGAWFGRAGGLIALGVVSSIALLATSVAEPRFAGERRVTETPTSALQVDDRYFIPAGAMRIDMSNIHDIERLDGKTIHVGANAGELVVILPDGVDATVDAHVAAAGDVDVLGQNRAGVGGVSLERSVDGGPDAPEIDLNLDLMVGHIEVRQ